MSCKQCQGIEENFDEKNARKELKNYRKKGPSKTTRMLLDAIKKHDVVGKTLLDIGGGIGSIQHDLLKSGVTNAVNVDASSAYLKTAKEEANAQGHAERIAFHHGDFVVLATSIPAQDIVTLDRVLCCFDDVVQLVSRSAERAKEYYGVVYPRDTGWVKAGFYTINFFLKLFRKDFESFIHPTVTVEKVIREKGLSEKVFYETSGIWQVVLFQRSAAI